MTGIEVDVETQAQRIADRGREALVERLRAAYGDAAAAHADLIALDDERIEALVQAAVDRADGLQWRRALARVASDELGLSVAEALGHPAVTRAQELVGAPSYEQSLAELIARPVPLPVTDGAQWPPAAALAAEADDVPLELLPEPDPIEYETEAYDVEAGFHREPLPPVPVNPFAAAPPAGDGEATEAKAVAPRVGEPADIAPVAAPAPEPTSAGAPELPRAAAPEPPVTEATFAAIHLGGVANLPTKREGLSVRLSADGLDILHGPDEIVGRLLWTEIETLEVPNLRVRRRRAPRARLVVRTPHGDASFEVPELSSDELRDRIEPLLGRYGRH
ncbi:MAG TPA: hypothetical protein VFN36_06890 [Solirubrobacteraceae bacterium]|nr:hypothetical protein [Solirubrobacteraceae bacterium]